MQAPMAGQPELYRERPRMEIFTPMVIGDKCLQGPAQARLTCNAGWLQFRACGDMWTPHKQSVNGPPWQSHKVTKSHWSSQ